MYVFHLGGFQYIEIERMSERVGKERATRERNVYLHCVRDELSREKESERERERESERG